ncbi:MAG: hypothetical protein ONB13_10590, partial [candidate division KSB1 bacterium]|nr:hypothetical protein [candidate division KSB1 bacterium]
MSRRSLTLGLIGVCLIFWFSGIYAQLPDKFQRLIEQGEFDAAQQLMRLELANNLNLGPLQRLAIAFEIERLDRIRKDFTKTQKEVIL